MTILGGFATTYTHLPEKPVLGQKCEKAENPEIQFLTKKKWVFQKEDILVSPLTFCPEIWSEIFGKKKRVCQ